MRSIVNSDLSTDYKFYVYRHIDINTKEPVYIGIGTIPEYSNTINSNFKRGLAMNVNGRSNSYYEYCLGTEIEYQIIFISDDVVEVKKKEQEFVQLYGRRDLGTGSLFNLTKGGDSLSESIMYATNSVEKICEFCGNGYICVKSRDSISKYCSKKCADKSSIKSNNICCSSCGKEIKRKPNEISRSKDSFCSVKCFGEFKSKNNLGKNNPNFNNKGRSNPLFKGDIIVTLNNGHMSKFIYTDNHPNLENNRLPLSRKVVEDNKDLFNSNFFDIIDGIGYLKSDSYVYHIDGDWLNCGIENLCVINKRDFFVMSNHKRDFGKKRGVSKIGNKYKATLAKITLGYFINEDDAYNCYWEKFKDKYGEYPW